MNKSLMEWRVTGKTSYAPSPLSAGFCLVWLGICLIGSHLFGLPRRAFYAVQAALVWQWFGLRNYPRSMGRRAWLRTIYSILISLGFGWLLIWILG